MSEYTPGPWRQCTGSHGDSCQCGMVWSTKADVPVATALGTKDEGYTLGEGVVTDSPQYHANARLMAASPELLEALRNVVAYKPTWDALCRNNPALAQDIHNAIAKASIAAACP